MDPEQITVSVWTPSLKQRAVLERYAIGERWYTASRACSVPDRTMADWLLQPQFVALGNQWRQDVMQTAMPMYGAIVEKAQRTMMRIKVAPDDDGDIEPDSKAAQWAERVLSRTLWPILLARGLAGLGISIEPRDALRALGSGNRQD